MSGASSLGCEGPRTPVGCRGPEVLPGVTFPDAHVEVGERELYPKHWCGCQHGPSLPSHSGGHPAHLLHLAGQDIRPRRHRSSPGTPPPTVPAALLEGPGVRNSKLRAVHWYLKGTCPSQGPWMPHLPEPTPASSHSHPQSPASRTALPSPPPWPKGPLSSSQALPHPLPLIVPTGASSQGPPPTEHPRAAPWAGPSRTLLVWWTPPLPLCRGCPWSPGVPALPHLLGSHPQLQDLPLPKPPLSH